MSNVIGVPAWQPGTTYAPGTLVTPQSNNVVTQVQPNNPSFETGGLTHWTVTSTQGAGAIAQVSASSAEPFDGTVAALFAGFAGPGPRSSATVHLENDFNAAVTPGQVINFSGMIRYDVGPNPNAAFANGRVGINWYTAGNAFISTTWANSPPPNGTPGYLSQVGGIYEKSSGQGVAPSNAAFAKAVFELNNNTSGSSVYADLYVWDYSTQGYPKGLVFVATQAVTGVSGTTEPVWPVTAGLTVTDNTVTWTAEFASTITWTAQSILTSGATQPNWPTTTGGLVVDNNIIWTAGTGLITDPNCPQSKIVAIGAGKVFAGDKDIVKYCATNNPLDWSTSQDAGFIPFGLQSYGNEDVAALGLYRSNLLCFNSIGYQMWQIDPDPNNIAILDAEPIGSGFSRGGQPANNDYVVLTKVGIRNIGTAGASGNLQAGSFGKGVDPIVKALIASAAAAGFNPRALFHPGTGQWWLIFGVDVVVLTINGASNMSWSRYRFPSVITDWTIQDGELLLRTGDLVWQLSDQTLFDDDQGDGINRVPFQGYMSWEYLDGGVAGLDKMMEGFDLTIGQIDEQGVVDLTNSVTCLVTVGYNQSNKEMATEPFKITGDTVPGTMVPLPLIAPSFQMRLDFGTGQNWGWGQTNLYVRPLGKA